MIINIIGECDKRPFLYTLMKFCQNLGDVLLVTNNTFFLRLSDIRESCGHYQNTMIAVTLPDEEIDDYMSTFPYNLDDFEYVIIDNMLYADSDAFVYCKGLEESETEKDMLEYLENYVVVEMFKNKNIEPNTLVRCEQFESMRDMSVVSTKMSEKVAALMSGELKISSKKAQGIANLDNVPIKANTKAKPEKKSAAPEVQKRKSKKAGGGPRVL